MPIPEAARSQEWDYVCSLAAIAVSNPARGMDACRLWVLCVDRQRSLRQAHHTSRGVLPKAECRSVIVKYRHRGLSCHAGREVILVYNLISLTP